MKLQEDGVDTAIQSIYRDLEYARTLIKRKNGEPINSHMDPEGLAIEEESWTFIGDESGDPELLQRIKDWEGLAVEGQTPSRTSLAVEWRESTLEADTTGSNYGHGIAGVNQSEKSLGKRAMK